MRHVQPHPHYRVLVFPGGTEIGLEIRSALADLKELELFSAGSAHDAHAPFAYRHHRVVPDVGEPGWLEELNAVIQEHRINVVYPGHDDVVLALAEHRDELAARPVVSPVETCRVARSKRQTYSALGSAVAVPAVFDDTDTVPRFPVFVKPDRGQGSRGARLVHDAQELSRAQADGSDLAMEYLPGPEYTVDCFSDRERGLLFVRGRRRRRIRAGISMSSAPEGDQGAFLDWAERIAAVLEFHGAWFFQLREAADGELKLLEVAPRIAGTMAVHRVLGVNFPWLSILEEDRVPVDILLNDISVAIDRALINRYRHDLAYSAVYVDLDDTLVVHGRVNVRLAAFLFQCVNEKRRLVLLTRHQGELPRTLDRHRLSGLWDDVVLVSQDEDKLDHIREDDAILIDDSFAERRFAHRLRGIRTFDSSMLEMLLNDRT